MAQEMKSSGAPADRLEGPRSFLQPAACSLKARCGVILLEVVLALALLVLASGVIVGTMGSCTQAAARLKLRAHGADLAVTLASQMHMGLLPSSSTDGGSFTEPGFSQWSWSMRVQAGAQSDSPLQSVQFTVWHVPTGLSHSLMELIPERPLRSPRQAASQPSGPGGGQAP
jgi:hypothetical protein